MLYITECQINTRVSIDTELVTVNGLAIDDTGMILSRSKGAQAYDVVIYKEIKVICY